MTAGIVKLLMSKNFARMVSVEIKRTRRGFQVSEDLLQAIIYYLSAYVFCIFAITFYLINNSSDAINYWKAIFNAYSPQNVIIEHFQFFMYGIFTSLPFSPLPSEATLLLAERASWTAILVAPAIGKAVGFITVYGLLQSRPSARIKAILTFEHSAGERWSGLRLGRLSRYASQQGWMVWLVFFCLQAIPFAPMRSAVVIYALAREPRWQDTTNVFVLSVFGGVTRIILMWLLMTMGITAIEWLSV